ncbi:AAEL013553-PA [Aedes aegypti]|uniref:Uncharacterized protein n=2 Tax=Aedes aegypti TaxID=7159 RepID=Q16IT3_AEDAE|nr:transcription factor grauzone [Aedes aegypti]EAT34180.1 AAEL013553-PA [Aedes aegypti]
MDGTSKVECRLCLEALNESKWTIDQPDLKKQINEVFRFAIDPQPGFSSTICSSCLTIVSEFHQYSERVRCNQDTLAAAARLKLSTIQQHVIKTEKLDFDRDESFAALANLSTNDDEVVDADLDGWDNDDVFAEPLVTMVEVKVEPTGKKRNDVRKKEESVVSTRETRAKNRESSQRSGSPLDDKDDTDFDYDDDDYQPETKKARKPRKIREPKIKKEKDETGDEEEEQEEGEVERPKRRRRKKDIALKSKEELAQEDIRIQEFYAMECDMCKQKAEDFESLRKHFRKEHGIPAYIKCCEKKLARKWALIDHILVHKNPDLYRCERCDKTFKGKRYLNDHIENVHGSAEEKPFKCEQCNRFFAKETLLRTHIANHKKILCKQCNQEFANSQELKEHLKVVHKNEHTIRVCDRCGKAFAGPSARSNLKQHIEKVHMGLGDKTKLQCSICRNWLLGKRALTRHMQLHSEVGKPHICDICNQNYLHSRALARHKRFVHVEQKYECEFCGKRFKRPLALKEHRATHTGEALYACKICSASTNSNASYYSHMKKAHPLEWAEQKMKAAEAAAPGPLEPNVPAAPMDPSLLSSIEPPVDPSIEQQLNPIAEQQLNPVVEQQLDPTRDQPVV